MADDKDKQALQDELVKLTKEVREAFEAKLAGHPTKADFDTFEKKIEARQEEIIDKLAELQKPQIKAIEEGKVKPVNPEHTKNWFNMIRGREFERKALVADATGQILIPEELEASIREGLPALTFMRSLASVRPVGRDRARIRKMNSPTMGWGKLETGSTAPETTLVPTEEYVYIEDLFGEIKVGVDELADSDINLSEYINRHFTLATSTYQQAGFIAGRGHTTYKEPTGIFASTSGITTVALDAANAITFQDIKDLIGALPAQYRNGASFIMAGGTQLELQKLRAEVNTGMYGDYYWQPSLIAGQPDTLLGYPVYTDESCPEHGDGTTQRICAFGNWRYAYEIYDRQGMIVKVLDQPYAESGLLAFLAISRVGAAVVWPDAARILIEP